MIMEFRDMTETNEQGGMQTSLPVRMDLIPARVLLKVAGVLKEGSDKYGENNWQSIAIDDHLNHALTHIYRYLDGDVSEPHLIHATCRLMFAAHGLGELF